MERRKFVKKLSVFTTGALVLSGSNLYALDTDSETKTENTSINLTPLSFIDKKITLKGNFIDSETLEPIHSVVLKAKVKKNRFLPLSKTIEPKNGSYEIQTGFSSNGNKINEKVTIEISAEGYKTFSSNLYLTANGCNIHSEIWDYNPKFKMEYCPKNSSNGNHTVSAFNFHLVRN